MSGRRCSLNLVNEVATDEADLAAVGDEGQAVLAPSDQADWVAVAESKSDGIDGGEMGLVKGLEGNGVWGQAGREERGVQG